MDETALGTKPAMVFETIRRRIVCGELSNNTKLGSVTRLAEEFGVSRGTIQKAIRRLESDGHVRCARGSGVYVVSPHEAEPDVSARSSAAERVAEDILTDIAGGTYAAGSFLPRKKVLRYRYNTSPAVIRLALALVEDRGLIQRKGASYLVGVPAADNVPVETRVVTVLGSLASLERMLNWRVSRDFLRALERELNRYGVIRFRPIDPNSESASVTAGLTRRDTVGFLFLGARSGRGGGKSERLRLQRHLNAASRTRLPVVIFNYANMFNTYPDFSINLPENMSLIVVDNAAAGESLGTYVASLGHKSVAFFGYFGDTGWCRERFRGFERGFKRVAADAGRVRYFHAVRAQRDAGEGWDRRNTADEIRPRLEAIFHGHSFTAVDPVAEVMATLSNYLNANGFRRVMAPCFREALTHKDITAWICAGEMQAIAALEFLRREGVDVPGRIGLAGINNDEDSIVHGLTMYDFQKDRMGYLAAHCFLGDIPLRRDRHAVLYTPGRIVVRGSILAPARAGPGKG